MLVMKFKEMKMPGPKISIEWTGEKKLVLKPPVYILGHIYLSTFAKLFTNINNVKYEAS